MQHEVTRPAPSEPQVGIEPTTARNRTASRGRSALCTPHRIGRGRAAQAPEARPIVRRTGNELATAPGRVVGHIRPVLRLVDGGAPVSEAALFRALLEPIPLRWLDRWRGGAA